MESYKLFLNYRRLRSLKRCNNFPTVRPTDVAQHSYFTTMLAMLFADEFNNSKEQYSFDAVTIDFETLMRKCLTHDLEEAFTSDIPFPVKHASRELNSLLESGIDKIMSKVIGQDNPLMYQWEDYRRNCKCGVEGSIVAFCDMLELALYCYEELSVGNKSFEPLLDNCNKYLDHLLDDAIVLLTGNDFYYLYGLDAETILPSICKLRHLVRRDSFTDEYDIQNFVTDIL